MIPEGPLNKMVPLTEDHGGWGGGAREPPLAHGLITLLEQIEFVIEFEFRAKGL